MPPVRSKRIREPEQPSGSGLTALHRSRLVAWDVKAVTAVAACPDGSVVAAGYEDGKVEIWDIIFFACIATIPGRDGAELSGLAWLQDATSAWRLFSSHLDGSLCELDPQRLRVSATSDAYGGAVWRIAPSPPGAAEPLLAAACDDGSVRLFAPDAQRPGLQYVRALARTEGRALAVAWHPGGGLVASAGSDGCIHVWEVATGHEALRITAGTSSVRPPAVWALLVLPDGTLVSGDSDGATQFWEPRHGSLLARFQRHAADVLALAASPAGDLVFASGVEPRVAAFHRVSNHQAPGPPGGAAAAAAAAGGPSSSFEWVYLDAKQPHSHDVRALAVVPPPAPAASGKAGRQAQRQGQQAQHQGQQQPPQQQHHGQQQQQQHQVLLLSGGVDGQLIAYPVARFLKEHPVRLTKAPQRPQLHLAQAGGGGGGAPRLLRAQGRNLDVWQLGCTAGWPPGAAEEEEGAALELAAAPSHLARITTSGPLHIASSALSPDGVLLACSDSRHVRLFLLGSGGGGSGVTRVRGVDGALPPAVALVFSADSRVLYAADGDGAVRALDAAAAAAAAAAGSDGGGGAVTPPAVLQPGGAGGADCAHARSPPVSLLAVSADGCWLAAAGQGGVQLLRLPGLAPAARVMLVEGPGSGGAVTALAFTPDSAALVVATGGGGLGAYACETGAATEWTLAHQAGVVRVLDRLPGCVQGLSFSPCQASKTSGDGGGGWRLVAWSAGGLCHMDLHLPLSSSHLQQKRRRSAQRPPDAAATACLVGQNGRVLLLENPCLFFGHSGEAAALLVERPWEEVLQQLPPPLYRHRYGS